MKANKQLLAKTLLFILDHPEKHDQNHWHHQGRNTRCFLGWAWHIGGVKYDGYGPSKHDIADLLGIGSSVFDKLYSTQTTKREIIYLVSSILDGGTRPDCNQFTVSNTTKYSNMFTVVRNVLRYAKANREEYKTSIYQKLYTDDSLLDALSKTLPKPAIKPVPHIYKMYIESKDAITDIIVKEHSSATKLQEWWLGEGSNAISIKHLEGELNLQRNQVLSIEVVGPIKL